MLEITATEIVSGVSGESEGKIRSLFDQVINSGQPCVLFMDEIEVIGQKKDNSLTASTNSLPKRPTSSNKIPPSVPPTNAPSANADVQRPDINPLVSNVSGKLLRRA